jgi:hypothetical protein
MTILRINFHFYFKIKTTSLPDTLYFYFTLQPIKTMIFIFLLSNIINYIFILRLSYNVDAIILANTLFVIFKK